MQKIKIAKIEVKEGDNDKGHWKNFIITGDDKSTISVFEPNNAGLKPSELREGDTLEGEIELKGKYANFISYKVIEHAKESEPAQTAKIPTPQREPFVSDPTRNASIEAQTAYGKIMDNWEKDIPESMKLAAARWGLSKLGVINMPKIEDCLKDYFKEAPEKKAAKESVRPAQPEAVLPATEGQAGRPAMMPQSIKTGAQLAAYAGKHGINGVEFTAITQAANPNDLKTEEQLIAAYNVLAPKITRSKI